MMYQNPYMNYQQNFNSQSMNERIDNQIAQLQQMKEQMKNNTQPAINQTIQLSPTSNNTIKYVDDVNEVSKELVFGDTPFFKKDMSVLWVKNAKGDVKTYELTEIIERDEKDLVIEDLQKQINELKGRIEYEQSNISNVDDEIAKAKSSGVSVSTRSTKKQK